MDSIHDSSNDSTAAEIMRNAPPRPTSFHDAYAAMPSAAHRQALGQLPVFWWENKASFGGGPQRFWPAPPSPSPSASPPLIPPYANYYDPYMASNNIHNYMQPQFPWNNNNNNNISNSNSSYTQTQTLPSPSLPLPTSAVTGWRHMITKQIEYYFSDDNLAKDAFIKMLMDDEGWVPIASIADFKRVRKLSRDNTQFVLDSLINTATLEVQGEKVRRRGCWKKWVISEATRKELKRLYGRN